jgi:hypothetical protein
MLRDIRKASMPDRFAERLGIDPWVAEHRLPILRRHCRRQAPTGRVCDAPRVAGGEAFAICFSVGMRQLAGLSLMTALEHNKNNYRVGF